MTEEAYEPLELPADSRTIENASDAHGRIVTPKNGGRKWRVMLHIPGTDLYKLKAKRGRWLHRSAAELEEGWEYAD